MRYVLCALSALACLNCGSSKSAADSAPKPEPVKITQFYADPRVPKGVKGSLCYGVEHAEKVELTPAVDTLWPSPVRCIEIEPAKTTTYTLTAYGKDGSKATQTIEVLVGAPPPRLFDLSVNATEVKAKEMARVCFKVENTLSVKTSAGAYDPGTHCVTDFPAKTTTYQITAIGGDHLTDTANVTVKVR